MEQILTLTNKSALAITAIDEVLSFDEKEIVLSSDGKKLVIKGDGLKVRSFDSEEKRFESDGEVFSVTYKDGAATVKKLFR